MTVLLQLTHNISTHTHIHHTAGFTIFPHIVAIVHTDPFVVDLYHHYRRRTHTEVPRHFSFFFTFFWQTGASRFLRTSTPWASLAMASLPPPTAGRRPFRGNALVAHIMGDSPPARFDQIRRGGEIYITIHQGDLRGFSLPQHGATNIASTAAHGWKPPVLGQRACCPHHGRLPTRSVRSNSSRGGEIYITIHQGDLRGFCLPQHGATDIASTAAHGWKTPVLGQLACCPHHGRLPTRSI